MKHQSLHYKQLIVKSTFVVSKLKGGRLGEIVGVLEDPVVFQRYVRGFYSSNYLTQSEFFRLEIGKENWH